MKQLLASFKSLPLGIKEDTENSIAQTILRELLTLFNGSRSYIFIFDLTKGIHKNTHEVCAEGITPEIDNLKEVHIDATPWWCNEILSGSPIVLDDIKLLMDRAKDDTYDILNAQNINSIIISPLIYNKEVFGYMGVDLVGRYRNWTQRDVQIMTAFSKSFTSAIYLDSNATKKSGNKAISNYIKILNTVPNPIALYGADAFMLELNDSALDFININSGKEYTRGDLISTNNFFKNFKIKEDVRKNFSESLPFTVQVSYRSKKGTTIYLTCNATPIVDEHNKLEFYIMVFTDLSGSYKKIIKDLEKAKNRAEESDRLKSAFLANMSHEIRTPLNAIIGFSSLIQETDDVEERKRYMQIINSSTDLLLHIIEDILDISKLESGIVSRSVIKFNLKDEFYNIYYSLANRVNEVNLEFRINVEEDISIVELDRNRLAQLITNFITNSIKHTQEGYIEMGYYSKNGGILFYVKDSGAGIPKENHHLVFKRFQKLNQFKSGTGLGLCICKAIVENAGGKIGFESEEGNGSNFWAWIPQ